MLSVVFAYIMMQSLNVELVSYRSNVYSSSVDHEIKQEIANIFYYFYSCYDISERNESFIPFYLFTLRQEDDNSRRTYDASPDSNKTFERRVIRRQCVNYECFVYKKKYIIFDAKTFT